MKHSQARRTIEAALSKVDSRLRLVTVHDGRLPASPETEVAYSIDTGPGTVITYFWVKSGRIQQTEAWDPYPYTYWDLSDPDQVSTWAAARKSLIRSNDLMKKMRQATIR
ncbi:MAG: hypothetical protein AB7L09_03245 [Nitrospira sp.]